MPGPLVTSALIAGGSALANGFLQQRAAAQNQAYNRQNMRENFAYSQQAQRNAAVNEVAGLKAAGLSPALANGAAAAPIANSSNGTAQAPVFDPANLLLMAQARKAEAEADNIEQEVGEKKTAGMTAALNLYNHFSTLAEQTKDENLKDFYFDMAEEARDSGEFAVGAQDAFRNFNQFYAESFEARERALAARLKASADELMLKDSEVAKALSRLPVVEYKKLVAEMSRLVADRDTARALKSLYESQTELNNEDAARVRELTQQIKDNNIVKAIESGDSGKTVAIFLGWLFQAISGLPGHVSVSQSSSHSTVKKE